MYEPRRWLLIKAAVTFFPSLCFAEFFTDADLTEDLVSPLSSAPGVIGQRHSAPHLHTHQLLLPDKLELLDPTHR